jgi:hypothetical protein
MTGSKKKRPAARRTAKPKSSTRNSPARKSPVHKSRARKSPARKSPESKSPAPPQLRIDLTGDQRLAENVIVELLAAVRRQGLEPPKVQILRKPRIGPKQALRARPKAK